MLFFLLLVAFRGDYYPHRWTTSDYYSWRWPEPSVAFTPSLFHFAVVTGKVTGTSFRFSSYHYPRSQQCSAFRTLFLPGFPSETIYHSLTLTGWLLSLAWICVYLLYTEFAAYATGVGHPKQVARVGFQTYIEPLEWSSWDEKQISVRRTRLYFRDFFVFTSILQGPVITPIHAV